MPKQRLLLPPRVTSPHLFSFNFFLYNHPHSFYPLSNSTSSSFFLHIIHKTHQLTYSLLPPKMADRQSGPRRGSGGATQASTNNLLRKLHDHAPNSSQLIGFLTLTISGAILLVLTGLTITATILGVIFFTPLILLSSPIWVPVGVVIFIAIAGFLSMCAFGLALLGGSSWLYKYLKGWHPPGSDRVDYARSRIAESASHVKDYAKEYGGYLQGKVKDAAPSA